MFWLSWGKSISKLVSVFVDEKSSTFVGKVCFNIMDLNSILNLSLISKRDKIVSPDFMFVVRILKMFHLML